MADSASSGKTGGDFLSLAPGDGDAVHFRLDPGTTLGHLVAQAKTTFRVEDVDNLVVLPSRLPNYHFRIERRR
ncbi:hypothetical protein A2755_00220 [Candidatus Wolfebacteria bacterium RIFCSPHIGHO2_01_FULL_48_22]|uniref:Uncharacterized protein n=1 Tax=Candidatus Wolfebacteria bacterium RIFCSPHIGHO2_01_FULL_48_22 TaxID=1802555 RepID=A0A1F8DQB1_9BACT|nr:MAG: hypothetical protein A2755_00220 [Candidatus Wolfebacteria bacterium RIFCSPHIGHO2_01_FULL_48_22]